MQKGDNSFLQPQGASVSHFIVMWPQQVQNLLKRKKSYYIMGCI
jgi:hypothetical protein